MGLEWGNDNASNDNSIFHHRRQAARKGEKKGCFKVVLIGGGTVIYGAVELVRALV